MEPRWHALRLACVGVGLLACDPPPLRDVSTHACLAPRACFDPADVAVVADAASGLTVATEETEAPFAPRLGAPTTLSVRVTDGARATPSVELDFVCDPNTLFPERQELHCRGVAERGPSPTREGSERLVVVGPRCTRYTNSPGQCPLEVARLVVDVGLDGSVSVEPLESHRLGGGHCEGWSTIGLRVGAEHLVRVAP